MKILIADKLSDQAVTALEKTGSSLRLQPDLSADDLPQAIDDAEILIVRSTKVTRETLERGTNISLVIRAGAGVNTIDLETASRLGIHVANCPGKNADAVAELTIGLMIALDRSIVDNAIDLRRGVWNKKLYGKADGLKGKTLGIVGMGSIGQRVAFLGAALGMTVATWSRSLTPERAANLKVKYCPTPLDLAREADVISLHLAAAAETTHLVNEDFLRTMKEGSYLINTSRGEIVDTQALQKIAPTKRIKVALDVYEKEPGASDKEFPHQELAQMITGTHHIGASTNQASEAIAQEVVNIVAAYRATGKPLHPVNARDKSDAPYSLVVRHYNAVGVLAGVLDILKAGNINIEEMENSLFSGGKAAVCTLKLDNQPSEEMLKAISDMKKVIKASMSSK